ncbi:MAG: hypothetical protein KIS78_31035 [Labilithrix sp.]|nr:hypothetical protein [Labilithrix sp.]MCW5836869.1 hypothetical protein [Labilithrix sp.]
MTDGPVKRAQLRVFRNLRRVGLVEAALSARYSRRTERHVDALPGVDGSCRDVLEVLKDEGLARSSAAALPFVSREGMTQLRSFAESLKDRAATTASSVHVPRHEIMERPDAFRIGLDARLLSLVENYLGVPVRYLGMDVKREMADAKENGIRLWHRDIEDHRMLKFIVYLSDVDDGAGPFEWLSRRDTDAVVDALRLVWGDVLTTKELGAVVPAVRRQRAVGARDTVHFFDPARILHRASPPTSRDRYSVTYSYATRRPYVEYPHVTDFNRKFVARWASLLGPAQRAALVE